jgi:hypothetical protein
MLKMPEPSSFPGEMRWHFDAAQGAVAAVCARCGMLLWKFWSRPPAGTALKVDPDLRRSARAPLRREDRACRRRHVG